MKFISTFVIGLSLFACSVHAPKEPIPTWVQERPMDPFNYIGIAKIEKALHPTDYKQVAKKAALNDLASEISIKIQSNSLVSSYDDNSGFQSDYSQFIKTEINKNLSGYQMKGEYENKKIYYVYYQLSKSKWREIQAQKKHTATEKAYQIYQEALKEEKALHYKFAINQYINALLAIKKYWNETVDYNKGDINIHLDNKIKENLLLLLKDIQLQVKPQKIILSSSNNYQENLQIAVTNKKGDYLASFPVEAVYYQKNTPKILSFSSETKTHNILINNVDYKRKNNSVRVKIQKRKLFNFKAEDRKFLQFIKDAFITNTINIPIQYVVPQVFIQENKKKPLDNYLIQKIKEGLNDKHINIVQNLQKSDYKISISTTKQKSTNTQRFKSAFLNYTINIFKTETGQLIYTKTITRTKGVDLSFDKALEKAYVKAAEELENEYIDDIINAFF